MHEMKTANEYIRANSGLIECPKCKVGLYYVRNWRRINAESVMDPKELVSLTDDPLPEIGARMLCPLCSELLFHLFRKGGSSA